MPSDGHLAQCVLDFGVRQSLISLVAGAAAHSRNAAKSHTASASPNARRDTTMRRARWILLAVVLVPDALAVTKPADASRSSVRRCPSVLGGRYYHVTVRNISCPLGRFVVDTFDGTRACSQKTTCVLVFHDTSRAGRRFRVKCFSVGGLGETVIIERCVFLADLHKPVSAQQATRFYIAP